MILLIPTAVSFVAPVMATSIDLGVQLLAALLLLVVMVLIHGAGIVTATRVFRISDSSQGAHHVDLKAYRLLTAMALWLFALHLAEIALFALFYLTVGALSGLEEALYFSLSAYSTLGQPDLDFPNQWRLLGAIEGLVGFLLIGWSTAVFFADMNKLLRERLDETDGPER